MSKRTVVSIANDLRRVANPQRLYGYKVMRVEGGKLISGANSRLTFPLKVGTVIQMPNPGIYLSLNKQYVIDYYEGLADEEVLLTLSFYPDDVLRGDPNDRQTELAVSKVTIEAFQLLSTAGVKMAEETAKYVVERMYTDDGDATEDFSVYDTQRKVVRFQGPELKAKQVCEYLNGTRKTDKHI